MFKVSACHWCYPNISLEDFCRQGKQIGLDAVDLLTPDQISIAAKFDLFCPMVANPVGQLADGSQIGIIEKAWNRLEHHDLLIEVYEGYLRSVAQTQANNVICFSGNRDGISDRAGMDHCARGIKQLIPLLEELDLTLTMELLNSKIDHPDYMCDHTNWGIDLCQKIGSDHFKLLYDVYHMQIMEGDIIATIRRHHESISHYHTGGVPGRNEIDSRQELNYRAIFQVIAETGFDGYVAHEFIPTALEPMSALRSAIQLSQSI